jgi:hypothetical protein
MRYRNTIIALVILVLLGSYIYLFEKKPIKNTEPGKPSEPFLAKSVSENIIKIELGTPQSGKPIVLELGKDKFWELKSPVVAKADKLEVDNLIKEFKDLVPSRILDEKGLDLAVYGLDTPALTVSLTFDTKKQAVEKIVVGNKTPNAEAFYVKKSDASKIYLIPVNSVALWSKEASVFRDKTVLAFDSDKIIQLDLKYPKNKFVGNKEQGQWWVTQPEKLKANQNKLDDLLWKLHGLSVKRFVEEQPQDLTVYGLNIPQIQVRLKSADGNLLALDLGKINDADGTMYAKTGDKSYIFSLETTAVNDIIVSSISDLRDRSVLTFESDSISKIELKYPDKTFVVVKEKEQWWVVQPNRIKADASKLDDILWRLSGLAIIEFGEAKPKSLNKYGLDNPSITISLQNNTQKIPVLFIGKDEVKKHLVYARTSDKDYLFHLDDSILQDLKITEANIAEKPKSK